MQRTQNSAPSVPPGAPSDATAPRGQGIGVYDALIIIQMIAVIAGGAFGDIAGDCGNAGARLPIVAGIFWLTTGIGFKDEPGIAFGASFNVIGGIWHAFKRGAVVAGVGGKSAGCAIGDQDKAAIAAFALFHIGVAVGRVVGYAGSV